jgi:hypothetical protein
MCQALATKHSSEVAASRSTAYERGRALGEQILCLDAECPCDLAEGPHGRLAPTVLDGVDRLRRHLGLPRQPTDAEASCLAQLSESGRVDFHDKHSIVDVLIFLHICERIGTLHKAVGPARLPPPEPRTKGSAPYGHHRV